MVYGLLVIVAPLLQISMSYTSKVKKPLYVVNSAPANLTPNLRDLVDARALSEVNVFKVIAALSKKNMLSRGKSSAIVKLYS